MRIENLIICENALPDGRDVLALIGLNQRLIGASDLPQQRRFAFVVQLTNESAEGDIEQPEAASLEMSLALPDGRRALHTTTTVVDETAERDTPTMFASVFNAEVQLGDFGRYELQAFLHHADGSIDVARSWIYVVPAEHHSDVEGKATAPKRAPKRTPKAAAARKAPAPPKPAAAKRVAMQRPTRKG